MIEIPEAATLAQQVTASLSGCAVVRIAAATSPHKLTWYFGNPERYTELAVRRTVRSARPVGGMVEIALDDVRMLFQEGVRLRYFGPGAPIPAKHQLAVSFSDGSHLVASVQMYGGLGLFRAGELENPYYLVAQSKPSPLTDAFSAAYFSQMLAEPGVAQLSAKAFLATEQRIPGLGNGVLQDILYRSRINPKLKIGKLRDSRREELFQSVRETLQDMTTGRGRDTEFDLYGKPGGYSTMMSRNSAGKPCPACRRTIVKTAYLGGSVYFCPGCQPLER